MKHYEKQDIITFIIFCIVIIIMAASFSSCTSNNRARNWGGTETIELNPGTRVVNVTWKETDLWILTKQDTSTKPTQYSFHEKSSLGVLEGEIIIIEK